MLEAYSVNQTIAADDFIPFNSVSLRKGFDVTLNGVSSIVFNKAGIYELIFDVSGNPGAGEVEIDMLRDGVISPQATINIPVVIPTVSITATKPTYVQVPNNNSQCPYDIPTTISFKNVGVALTDANVHICVRKVK